MTTKAFIFRSGLWAQALGLNLAALLAAPALSQQAPVPSPLSQTAHFKVTTTVVNPIVEPFTATITGFGNSLFNTGSGFEPVIFRNKYIATQDSTDRIFARPEDISNWDTYREGMLDGALVRVCRIENGKFQLVRQDSVVTGGFNASGWVPLIPKGSAVPADQPVFRFRWSDYNRPAVPYYFAVRAVDAAGKLSPLSNVVAITRPEKTGSGDVGNTFRPIKNVSSLEGDLPAPTGLIAQIEPDYALRLSWTPATDGRVAGYLVYRSDYAPDTHQGYYMQLSAASTSPNQQIKAGDMVILEKKFYDASRKRYHSNRVWGAWSENQALMPGLVPIFPDEDPAKSWELVKHDPNTPVTEAGETHLRLHLATGSSVALGGYSYAGTGQSWYPVLEPKPYRVDVWLRQQGSAKVTFRVLDYFNQPGHKIEPIDFKPGQDWQRFTATFTPPVVQPGSQPGRIVLDVSGPGTIDVDNFRVYREDTAYLDYTDQEYADLKQSGMQALRTHGFARTMRRTYDLEQLTNPGGVISLGYITKTNTLPQSLAMMRKAGVRPWLQIEPHLSPDEWRGLVEYLAAPYRPGQDTPQSKPWAWKRFLQGQVKPWTDEFDRIYFELGNETWNGLFRPWVFEDMTDSKTGKRYSSGQVYGLYQEHVIAQLRESLYWKSAKLDDKVEFVLGGWSGFRYGLDAASSSASSQHLTVAAYIGGWDSGEQALPLVPRSFNNLLHNATRSAIPRAEKHTKEVSGLIGSTGRALRIGTYEAGPGYTMNGLNNARVTPRQSEEQELVMKSLASGVATLDVFLAQASLGYGLQNYFTFGPGAYWTSHAPWYDGGQAYPAWKALSLFNNYATGGMLVTQAAGAPTVETSAAPKTTKAMHSPAVAVYATQQKQRLSVFVISRKLAGYPEFEDAGFTPVVIDLPFKSAASVTLYRMAGEAIANNLKADNVTFEKLLISKSWRNASLIINNKSGAGARGLPPSSVFLYVFDDVKFGDKARAAGRARRVK